MSSVVANNIIKKYDATQVIHGVDLGIKEGEFCVFVGPSGCGKSTLLRMIAGLEEITDGNLQIGGKEVTHADPASRGVAMVFQSYALYPHMTVAENMGFGLKVNNVPKSEIEEKVNNAARILKLEPYLKRKPKALSGGQRQRVAIGRAIVRDPEVFLFDEPLSNLDAELRVEMRVEIARLHKQLGSTMIYVTHDQVEAMTLADKIVVLRDGRIQQIGSPLDLYDNPDSKFVAGFIGSPGMNFLQGTVVDGGVEVAALGNQVIPTQVKLPSIGSAVTVGLRPQQLSPTDETGPLTLDIAEELGSVSYLYLDSPTGERLIAEIPGKSRCESGTQVGLQFDPEHAFFFDAESEMRIR